MPPIHFCVCDDQRALESSATRCGRVALALDTEFVGEDTFIPRLELIQSHRTIAPSSTFLPSGQRIARRLLELICDAKMRKSSTRGGKISIFLPYMQANPKPFSIPKSPPMVGMAPSRLCELGSATHARSWRSPYLYQLECATVSNDKSLTLGRCRILLSIHTHLRDR